jgi:hypothetical protein
VEPYTVLQPVLAPIIITDMPLARRPSVAWRSTVIEGVLPQYRRQTGATWSRRSGRASLRTRDAPRGVLSFSPPRPMITWAKSRRYASNNAASRAFSAGQPGEPLLLQVGPPWRVSRSALPW